MYCAHSTFLKKKKNTAGAWKSSQHPPRLLAHASGTAAKLPRSLEVGSEYPCSQLCLGLWEKRRGQSHMVCDGVGLLGISRAKPASPADIGCFPFSLLRGTCRWSVLSLAFYPLLSASHCATQGDARGSSTIQLLATNQLALPLLSGSSSSSWLCAGEGQHTWSQQLQRYLCISEEQTLPPCISSLMRHHIGLHIGWHSVLTQQASAFWNFILSQGKTQNISVAFCKLSVTRATFKIMKLRDYSNCSSGGRNAIIHFGAAKAFQKLRE